MGWIGSLENNALDLHIPRFEDILARHGKIMVKGICQLPPCNCLELLCSNIWCLRASNSLIMAFTYARAHELQHKGIQCIDNIRDSESRTFLLWDEAHEKFSLTAKDSNDWIFLTPNIINQCWHRQTIQSHSSRAMGRLL